jgi:spore coat protein CotH
MGSSSSRRASARVSRRGAVRAGALALTTLATLGPAAAIARAAGDPVFNQAVFHEVRLVMDPADWQALRDNFRTNQYYAANIAIDGEVLQQVGIRSRGDGSRNQTKPGLKIDFNKYIKTQEFHGYKTMVLDNLTQDPALMREKLSFAVFEAMGIPAPQLAHARLTVNDQYWGVYTLVESVSKPFLKARIGQESGNLFDYEYAFAWDFSYRGPEADKYVPVPFDPQTNEDKLDASGLVAFFRTISETPEATFTRDIAAWIDIPRFLAHVAVENALAEYDGVVGEFGANNFYLYQYGGQNRFVFIPWDKETCLQSSMWPVDQRLQANLLTRKLMADPANQRIYQEALQRAAAFVNPRFLGPIVEQTYTLIREAALTDTKKQITNDEFEAAVGGLRVVIAAREADLAAQLPQ